MPQFLWVEDFKASEVQREENIVSSTAELVFGSILKNTAFDDEYEALDLLEEQSILLKLNLLDALEFINNPAELATVDFIVLDVDMPLKREGQPDNNDYLPPLIEQYQSEAELKRIAGYQLYIDLVIELGFPKSHILFCSNHAGYFEEFTEKFKSANIKFPQLLKKEHSQEIKHWLTEAHSDYFVLRRSIIDACEALKQLPKDKIAFNQFVSDEEKKLQYDELQNYLEVLANFLPLREPENKSNLYKLFLRTLVHEWEAAEPKKIKGLAWIMKSTRNWMAHNSNLFDSLDEQTLAYLFMMNMRSMFNLAEGVQTYEEKLLSLFDNEVLEKQQFKDINSNKLMPISKVYCTLKNAVLDENIKDATFQFRGLANNIQDSLSPLRDDKAFFTKILYQMFWLNQAYPYVDTQNRKILEIRFKEFVYQRDSYLFEMARHIYKRSFLEN